MADMPYDIIPHKDVLKTKKQMQELLDSMAILTKTMNAMLKLFTEAAGELKREDKDEAEIGKNVYSIDQKLGEIIEQNKALAEGMIAISDMMRELSEKQSESSGSERQSEPKPFEPAFRPQEPSFPREPAFQQPPRIEPPFGPRPMPQGPVAMPSVPFSSLEGPKKKGLFGRIKR